jgi:hypothetical protein
MKALDTIGKFIAVSIFIFTISGCGFTSPKVRLGSLPTPTFGVPFADPNNLGRHSYTVSPFENGGIVYTCKAGHIDLDHVRGNADATKYLIERINKTLTAGKENFSFTFSMESSDHHFKFTYPANWNTLSKDEQAKIIDEVSFSVGPYLAYNGTVWHEILTWFGVHFGGFEEEFNSSFSWEDQYSNLLGTRLAVEALRDTRHNYNNAMTIALEREMIHLEIQPKKTAIEAGRMVQGKWFTGNFVPTTIKKNTDIGIDDGYVTPVLIPGICDDEPLPYPVPNLDVLAKHGFSLKYTIRPREFEANKILRVIYPDGGGKTIEPVRDFPIYMDYIEKQAVEKYHYIVTRKTFDTTNN